jgi:phage baseplate assembly protein V
MAEKEGNPQMEHSESPCAGRYGYVSAYDAKRHMARVRFLDKDNLVSAWLPVGIPNSQRNKDEFHLDVNEHVFCVMQGNGLEAGTVICAIWDDKNKPPLGDPDIRRTEFEDGTIAQYDRKEHRLIIDCSQSAGRIEIIAPSGIAIKSNVSIDGNLSVAGNVTAGGNIIDGGGNTNHHSH